MRATITRLRERGKRRHETKINSDPGIAGDLTLSVVGTVRELKLADPNDQQMKPLIPILYEPELTTMHGNGMLFRGYESVDGAGYVQEWRAVLT
jgi:hypothetical protein